MAAQWEIGLCYYYGRGVERDVAQATEWFKKAAAQGNPGAAQALQSGVAGFQAVREVMARFTNAGSAPRRHEVAHAFAGQVNEQFLGYRLQKCSQLLKEVDSAVPHHSLRNSMWVDFMLLYGLSDEDLALS
jgi:TPR repeat protein